MFSLSLIGNGFDCHRTIESLILGNIVLLQSSPIDSLFEGLPVVIIKDWRDINEENLHLWAQQYEDALTNPKYREKLTSDYWINKVISESTSKQPYKSTHYAPQNSKIILVFTPYICDNNLRFFVSTYVTSYFDYVLAAIF